MSRPTSISGSWVAVPTPMHEDGSVHYDELLRLVDFQAAHGTSAVLLTGSAGEVAMLDPQERREIIRRTAGYAADRILAFYGTTCATTAATVDLTRYAEDNGAAGVVLTVPAYSLPPQSAILDFLATVATSTELAVAVYNNPMRVHRNIEPETMAELHRVAPNFVADKEAVADAGQISRVLELTGHELSVLACDNPGYGLMPTAVALADGMANITGNVHPAEMAYLSDTAHLTADVDDWRRRYLALLPLMRACYSMPNPVAVKAALELLGFAMGPPRLPLRPLHGALLDEMRRLIEQHHLADRYGARTASA